MSAAWNGGLTRELSTPDGLPIRVVFPGHWTHGFGPDFSDAMLDFGTDGLQTGAVELHTRSSDWIAHGHHLDDRYNNVILHVVTVNDEQQTRRADGRIVPVAVLTVADDVLFAIDRRLPDVWAELGGTVCAADLSERRPDQIRAALQRLGDERLAARVAAIEGALSENAPASVLLESLLDGFGYSENRGPMRQLAGVITRFGIANQWPAVSMEEAFHHLLAHMLGIGGFLPLSPAEAHLGRILPDERANLERIWSTSRAIYDDDILPATAWHLGRTRPANHPVTRIVQATTLLARTGGSPLGPILDAFRTDVPLVDALRDWTNQSGRPPLGENRATNIVASVLIPFALAYASHTDDPDLEDAASRAWGDLRPAGWMRPAKRALGQVTGGRALRNLGERGHQGLLQLDRTLCTPRRCFQCPIAAEVIRDMTE
jgi:hypothetical protein